MLNFQLAYFTEMTPSLLTEAMFQVFFTESGIEKVKISPSSSVAGIAARAVPMVASSRKVYVMELTITGESFKSSTRMLNDFTLYNPSQSEIFTVI